jgi:hypothetical protein
MRKVFLNALLFVAVITVFFGGLLMGLGALVTHHYGWAATGWFSAMFVAGLAASA